MNASASTTVRIPPVRERLRVVLGALGVLARDPGRLDQVLLLAQTVNAGAVSRAIDLIASDPEGKALLAEQPRIDRAHVDLDALERLPDGTLGREYARFLRDNGITPDVFEIPPDVGDPRAAYVMLRMRQSHDLWHVLTGYRPDVRGEILLQAFSYAQTGAPSALIIALFGTLRYGLAFRAPDRRVRPRELRAAYEHGRRAKLLATFRWEQEWATPVAALRDRLACPAATIAPVAA